MPILIKNRAKTVQSDIPFLKGKAKKSQSSKKPMAGMKKSLDFCTLLV